MFSTHSFAQFLGGQIEIHQNGSLFRGDVETLEVQGEKLVVRFAWIAKREASSRWVNYHTLDYEIELQIHNISSGHDDRRLYLLSSMAADRIVFFPMNDERLYPGVVEGLHLAGV